jgi:hypothetical protein
MAIDTATKRYAMINFGNGDEQYPVPDGTIAAVDRQHFLGLYLQTAAAPGTASSFRSLALHIGMRL